MTAPSFEHLSVLIIDDEKFTRMVMVRMLSNLGFKDVFQAEDGSTGLTAVRDLQPNAVVCDIEMKPMSGLAFLEALRASPEPGLKTLPVVFITNRLDPDRLVRARELGSGAFILKPVTPTTLKERLTEALFPA